MSAQDLPHAALNEVREAIHRPDFRRTVIFGILALAAPGVVAFLGGIHAVYQGEPAVGARLGSYAAILCCLVFGLVAVRSTANEVARLVRAGGGVAASGVLRLLITLVGYIVVVMTVVGLLIPLGGLALPVSVTGVVVGIAAQQSLGNCFAGIVLLFSRPFSVGDRITLRSGALGGQYDGEVTAITLTFTMIQTDEGPISLPNSGVLAAATGRRNHVEHPEPPVDT
ncbi:MAG TPA: mechanosensitive ion channel family protein [Pseudonocardiaceae bacterium]|jgi:small-conductance mechanosensitive channel|nr:mechanosensitive ion channel family protein [Pseudonocardiaceae bacterium]